MLDHPSRRSGLHNNERGAELDPPIAECCRNRAADLVFDPAGNWCDRGWPGPGYEWPQSNHGVHVDYKGNVWIGGNGEKDAQILKFTKDGKFLLQVGHFGGNAGSTTWRISAAPQRSGSIPRPTRPTWRTLQEQARRGARRRHRRDEALLGAYGNKPDDTDLGPTIRRRRRLPSSATRCTASSARMTGWSMCCDRRTTACRCSKPDGKFVKEAFYARNTRGAGSVWDITFSKDPDQRFIFLADGPERAGAVILREHARGAHLVGDGGRQPGQFYGVHSIAS